MLGSDVVDLLDPETRAEGLHRRFDERVFSAAERAGIARAQRGHEARWRLWAMKEAAYKLVRRIDPRARFSPVRFETDADGVRFDGRRIPVRVSERTGLVHAVAAFALARARERVSQLERRADPAAGARSLARDAAARVLGVESSRLAIERADRVPILLLDGIPAPLVVSLSHHGRFAACALGPPAFGAWA